MLLSGPVDVKKKYNASWALVTGAGTGIGKSIAESMALQGLNVVLHHVAQDTHIESTLAELKSKFPSLEFRTAICLFDHKTDYMPIIIEATKGIDVSIVFNNAGYMVTGFFDHTDLDAQLANMECNATACVKVTHHFLKLMLSKKIRGCFIFTSSVSGYIPNPFAVMYGATKSFVSQFAASLAIEVRNSGIDVLAVHPSPVNSNFFDKVHKIDSLEMAKKAAVSPASVPGKMLTCVGRCHLGDIGQMAVIVRMFVAVLPYDCLAGLFSYFAPLMGDYKKHNTKRGEQQPPAVAAAAPSTRAPKSPKAESKKGK